jgi:hypothetical protein
MRYILNLPNYKGSFSFMRDGQHYSLPQSPSGEDLDDAIWAKIKDATEIEELQEAKLLHILQESEPKRSTAKTAATAVTEPKTADK